MAKEEQSDSIYEARDEKIVSPTDGKSTIRIGRFLKPCVRSLDQAVSVPNIPILSEIFPSQSKEWHSKVHFKGWRIPQKKWDEWLDRLVEKYAFIWNQAGIFDAIMSSRYEIRCNRDLVLGLVEFWCPETNTFVFPWGEATITLEDVMILGGFPVLGEPVLYCPCTKELVKIEETMGKLRKEVFKSIKAKKTVHHVWIKYFMENESEFEHEAFLSLWLSRYVFPSLPEKTIGNDVFPIAGRLSRGTQIALAPAVLASLYHNLRLLKEKAVTSVDSIPVLGLFQLVQLWAFERLPVLGPKCPNPLKPGEPRVAQWHKLNSTITLPLIRCVLRLPDTIFQWRPYAADLKNWCHLSYYKENEQLVIDCSSLDEELQTFFQFLCATELVGLDCRSEKYMPHRVAMQFGMDQDLPGEFSDLNFTRGNAKLFIPPRSFEPGVSVRYSIWWKESISAREEAINEILLQSPSVKAKMSKNKEDLDEGSPNMLDITSSDDESQDNIPISEIYSMRVPQNNAARTTSTSEAFTVKESKNDTESIRKRKLSSIAEGNKHTIPSSVNDGGKEVERDQPCGFANHPKEAADSENDLSDIAFLQKMKIKRHNGSGKGGAEEGDEEQKAGLGSFNNPICIDKDTTSTTQKLGLEERIQKLEKLLGLKRE